MHDIAHPKREGHVAITALGRLRDRPDPPKKSSETVRQKSLFDSDLPAAAEKLAWKEEDDEEAVN
jgi:hypothetical protein